MIHALGKIKKEENTMARHTNKNQNVVTEEPVVKENSAKVMAEETAKETAEPITEKTVEEVANESAEEKEVATDKRRIVVVACDKLYIRPEPNKKRDIGILSRGSQLFVNDADEKLPEGWLSVTTKATPDGKSVSKPMNGYVVADYVTFIN